MPSEIDSERVTKWQNKQTQSVSRHATNRVTAVVQEPPKYHLHENDDSIIIEVANPPQTTLSIKQETPTKSINDVDVKEKRSSRIKNNIRKVKSIDKTTEAMVVDSKISCNITEPIESFVDLKTLDYHPDTDLQEPMEATNACGLPSLPPDLPTLDDFNCMDYHIIELNAFGTKDKTTTITTAYSNKSDDDIEHIFNSDDNSLGIVGEKMVNYDNIIDDYDASPMRHRKCSKSTISDDDLEHIQTSEISELFERARSLAAERDDFNYQEDFPKQSSDDELEHIVHPEEAEIEKIVILPSPSSSPPPPPPAPLLVQAPAPLPLPPSPMDKSPTSKSQMSRLFSDNRIGTENMKKQASTPRGSRKRKDVVVIDSEPSNSDVTVIVKSLGPIDERTKVISPIKELVDDTEQNIERKEDLQIVDQVNLQSLPKKTKVRTPKSSTTSTNIQKAMSNCIEIIDIDAMQKAEMEVTNIVTIPECKILEQCSEMSGTRLKKSRRNKKIHGNEGNNLISSTSKQCEQSQIAANKDVKNWDSIVYKPSLTDNLEINVDEVSRDFENETLENEFVPEVVKNEKLTKKHVKKSVELKPDDCASLIPIITENTVQKVSENDLSKNPPVEESTCDEMSLKIDDKIDRSNEVINEVINESKIDLDDEKLNIKVDIKSADDEGASKKTDKDQEIAAERSLNSSDHLSVNVVPMDTEEDTTVKEIAEKNNVSTTIPPSWSAVAKKNNRSKKKKRR